MLMGKQKDVKMMTVYGYARLVGFNENFELVPISWSASRSKEGRIFTFHLRPGHKWSDGHPFTTEDFRYYWEDLATNPKFSRGAGPPSSGRWQAAEVESSVRRIVRYHMGCAQSGIPAALAGASPCSSTSRRTT